MTPIQHAPGQMQTSLEAVGARDVFRREDDADHTGGTARMGFDRTTSVVDADCRSWDIPSLWVCDGSVFPTGGSVNPHLTITAIAMRTAAAPPETPGVDPYRTVTAILIVRSLPSGRWTANDIASGPT